MHLCQPGWGDGLMQHPLDLVQSHIERVLFCEEYLRAPRHFGSSDLSWNNGLGVCFASRRQPWALEMKITIIYGVLPLTI